MIGSPFTASITSPGWNALDFAASSTMGSAWKIVWSRALSPRLTEQLAHWYDVIPNAAPGPEHDAAS